MCLRHSAPRRDIRCAAGMLVGVAARIHDRVQRWQLERIDELIVWVAPSSFPPRCEHLPPGRIERSDQRVDVLNRWLVHAADPEPGWR